MNCYRKRCVGRECTQKLDSGIIGAVIANNQLVRKAALRDEALQLLGEVRGPVEGCKRYGQGFVAGMQTSDLTQFERFS